MGYKKTMALGVIASFFSFSSNAENLKEYKVGISSESGKIPVMLVEAEVNKYTKLMKEFATKVSECETSSGNVTNPFIGRDISYSITSSKSCRISFVAYDSWSYDCLLSESDRREFGEAIMKRAETFDILSDFSVEEKSIMFSTLYCDMTRN